MRFGGRAAEFQTPPDAKGDPYAWAPQAGAGGLGGASAPFNGNAPAWGSQQSMEVRLGSPLARFRV